MLTNLLEIHDDFDHPLYFVNLDIVALHLSMAPKPKNRNDFRFYIHTLPDKIKTKQFKFSCFSHF